MTETASTGASAADAAPTLAPPEADGAGRAEATGIPGRERGGMRFGGWLNSLSAEKPRSIGIRKNARAIRPPTGGEAFAPAATTKLKIPSSTNNPTATARAAVERRFTRAGRPA